MKTEPIQDYILQSEHNLRIAAAVGEAWPDAREKLVSTFLDRLDARLKRKLKGWESGRWGGRFFLAPYPGYCLWKPAWQRYDLALSSYEYGERMIFGVCLEKRRPKKQPYSEELLEAVRKIQPSARPDLWCEARITMSAPATDWRKPEVLWQVHKDAKFLESVAEQLLDVAKVSEKIIDQLERRKK